MTVRPFRAAAGCAVAGSLLIAPAAYAQGRPAASDGLSARLGVLGMVAPDYEGSDDYEVKPVPYVDISYGKYLFLNYRGLGANLLAGGPLTAGVAINYDDGRDEDENSALRGLGDVDATAVGDLFATYQIGAFAFSADIGGDLLGEGSDGLTASLSATYTATPADGLMLIVGPSLTWASDNYMQAYFGIDDEQSARSGRPAYGAEAGLKDVGVTLFGLYQVTDGWALTGIVGYKRLLGDAADSPLVDQDGSADQLFGGIGVSYSF